MPVSPAAGAQTTPGLAITHIEFSLAGLDIDGEHVRIENNTASPITLRGWCCAITVASTSIRSLRLHWRLALPSSCGPSAASMMHPTCTGVTPARSGTTPAIQRSWADAAGNEIARFSYKG